jgi:hypothetical protein
MECFDFAATIQQRPSQPMEHLVYHTYWRADLLPFETRQVATIKSFLATQPLSHSRLLLWTNDIHVLGSNLHVRHFLTRYPDNLELRQVDVPSLARGTYLEGSDVIGFTMYDKRGWVDGDAIRLLLLWNHGGVWLDMDEILTRDLHPLTEHEFVSQWDCYGTYAASLCVALRLVQLKLAAVLEHYRQAISRVQWRGHALPPPLAIPLRSVPYHGNFAPSDSKHS